MAGSVKWKGANGAELDVPDAYAGDLELQNPDGSPAIDKPPSALLDPNTVAAPVSAPDRSNVVDATPTLKTVEQVAAEDAAANAEMVAQNRELLKHQSANPIKAAIEGAKVLKDLPWKEGVKMAIDPVGTAMAAAQPQLQSPPQEPGTQTTPPPAQTQAAPVTIPPVAQQQPHAGTGGAPPGMAMASYTPGVKLSPKLLGEADDVAFDEASRIEDDKQRAINKAAETNALQIRRNEEIQQQNAAAALKQQEIQKQVDTQVTHYQAAIDDFHNAKIDPQKYFKDIGPIGTVLSVLASGLGAGAASLTHGENFAGKWIDSQINRSIAAQEREIETKKQSVDINGNLVAMFRQKGLDAQSASLAAKQALLENFAGQFDALASKYSGQEAGSAYTKEADGLRQNINDKKQQQFVLAQSRATYQPEQKSLSPDLMYKMGQDAKALSVTLPQGMHAKDGGTEVQAKTPKLAEEMGDILDQRANMMGAIATMRANMGWGESFGQPSEVLTNARNQITEAFHNMEGKGIRFTDSDRQMFEQVADPTSWKTRDSTVERTLKEAEAVLNRKMTAKGREAFGDASPL